MWNKGQTGYYYLPIFFGCIAYLGKFLFTKQFGPVIEIASGKIQGVLAYSREGREYFQYLGIPFAKPPVSDLRFQTPQPADNWTDVLVADRFGSPCIGVEFLSSGRLVGEEDCLYLNVFTPKQDHVLEAKLLPVMVFIHGGGFITGYAHAYGEQYLMDQDIVLVSMNYRLGIFGFLNAEDESARGNMGLKDQSMALRWVQENIEQFGGDPNKITIFGESAGGASVHYHLLSPMSKGLFHKAISMSGNALNPFWQMNRSYSEQVEVLGEEFKCPVHPRHAFVECMKKIDAHQLGALHAAVQSPIHPLRDAYSPSIEVIDDNEAFLVTQPYELLRQGKINKVPWMTGANAGEGLVFVARVMFNSSLAARLSNSEVWNKYMPVILFYDERKVNASQAIRRKYLGEKSNEFSVFGSSEELARLFSDRLFFQSLESTAKLHAQHAPVYLYKYTHRGAMNIFNVFSYTSPYSFLPIEFHAGLALLKHWVLRNLFGIPPPSYPPCHGDEMFMVFNINSLMDVSKSETEDYEMSQTMLKTWTDFAKDVHSFKFRNITWSPLDASKPIKYLNLDPHGSWLDDPYSESLQLWETHGIL